MKGECMKRREDKTGKE